MGKPRRGTPSNASPNCTCACKHSCLQVQTCKSALGQLNLWLSTHKPQIQVYKNKQMCQVERPNMSTTLFMPLQRIDRRISPTFLCFHLVLCAFSCPLCPPSIILCPLLAAHLVHTFSLSSPSPLQPHQPALFLHA